jgi:Rrf2 family protein
LIITRATEHSITAMLYLASKHPAPVVSKRDICEAEGITPAFLTKILQPLIRKGLVNSKRGVAGGFQLATNPEELTVWDVMQAVEEPLALNVCLTENEECGRSSFCPVHCMWLEMKSEMKRIFSGKSLAQLARERAEQGPGTCSEPGCKQ